MKKIEPYEKSLPCALGLPLIGALFVVSLSGCGGSTPSVDAARSTPVPTSQASSRVSEHRLMPQPSVRCYSAPDPKSSKYATVGFSHIKGQKPSSVSIDDAKGACAAMYRQGLLVEGAQRAEATPKVGKTTVPELSVCLVDKVGFAVFPSTSCAEMGLDDA